MPDGQCSVSADCHLLGVFVMGERRRMFVEEDSPLTFMEQPIEAPPDGFGHSITHSRHQRISHTPSENSKELVSIGSVFSLSAFTWHVELLEQSELVSIGSMSSLSAFPWERQQCEPRSESLASFQQSEEADSRSAHSMPAEGPLARERSMPVEGPHLARGRSTNSDRYSCLTGTRHMLSYFWAEPDSAPSRAEFCVPLSCIQFLRPWREQ
ncbi:unnamed protein product [Polarella glacialis]|uniref:Uncharacterized protein n=1 Tax=Polarella glacialis TaxID=89957 RepID=A0A813DL07_POLGL|nr:unnamed protein product [Polarella glacialis]